MALDINKIHGFIGVIETIVKSLVRLVIPAITVMLIIEIVFGVNIGLVERVIALSVRKDVRQLVGGLFVMFVAYKAVIK